ncbi:MAG: hypothetical protein IJ814_05805 [Paludibacteraceae bacterium]|nr:hypothetical protein [Paludibacteraceae bacterium]
MRPQERIRIDELCARLQNRLKYEDPRRALDVLLYGWCKHRKHDLHWLSDVKRRGWLSIEMARDFAAYCGNMFV